MLTPRNTFRLTALLTLVVLTGCEPRFHGAGTAANIVVGGQAEIDAGHVVAYNNGCMPDTVADCTVWLAGHNSTHGSPFAGVDNMVPGDKWLITDTLAGVLHIHRYTVTHTKVVQWGDPSTPLIYGDAILQTSLDDNTLILVYSKEG